MMASPPFPSSDHHPISHPSLVTVVPCYPTTSPTLYDGVSAISIIRSPPHRTPLVSNSGTPLSYNFRDPLWWLLRYKSVQVILVDLWLWKKPAAPKGLPGRSPTPVLSGPCTVWLQSSDGIWFVRCSMAADIWEDDLFDHICRGPVQDLTYAVPLHTLLIQQDSLFLKLRFAEPILTITRFPKNCLSFLTTFQYTIAYSTSGRYCSTNLVQVTY